MSGVTLKGVRKNYGSVTALEELDLDIEEGEFITLLGPSGCGKTTTLRLIAGFIEPTRGQIFLGDDDVTALPPQHREIGMVFQDYALFPHLTIRDNIGFALKERRVPNEQINARVTEMLDLVRLPGIEDRYPAELSGGQAQRIAVARAVAHPPRVLLMDEPLGALDLKLRETMQIELRRIQQELQITTVFVTHDQTEAMNMSDRIAVLNHGRLVQTGSAEDIYNRPSSRFVADFVGRINLFDASISDAGADADANMATVTLAGDAVVRVPNPSGISGDGACVAVRPEHLRISNAQLEYDTVNKISGRVIQKVFSGNFISVFVDTGGEKPALIEDRPENVAVEVGQEVTLWWHIDRGILLTD